MKAYHITGIRENYFAIHRDGFLRPRDRETSLEISGSFRRLMDACGMWKMMSRIVEEERSKEPELPFVLQERYNRTGGSAHINAHWHPHRRMPLVLSRSFYNRHNMGRLHVSVICI